MVLPRSTCDARLRRRDPRPGPISICRPHGARLPIAVCCTDRSNSRDRRAAPLLVTCRIVITI